ncbi:hypothetical protein [Pseudosulfitobacter sp. SM2401]|uniref:hypothetical protein n=1 Tax=Pseudosulfitobacter sp. SM2401 TaxID=3350098 RepID=UPI0036F262A0
MRAKRKLSAGVAMVKNTVVLIFSSLIQGLPKTTAQKYFCARKIAPMVWSVRIKGGPVWFNRVSS